jgi:hypothetical protein
MKASTPQGAHTSDGQDEVLLWSPEGSLVIGGGLGPRNPMAQLRRASRRDA